MRCHICGTALGEDRHDDHEPGCSGLCRCDLPACRRHCATCNRPPRRRRTPLIVPAPAMTVTGTDLAAIGLKPAVFYYACRRITAGETLEAIALDLKLEPAHVAYIDQRTAPDIAVG